ncbi:hypothetical protein FSP39_016443 [Pinctada imbricata]|uniref:Fatty acid 2-hydroxylase n=1 Tax=Pinctada imbricata TaxID=66713 RepID=A0AA89BXH5_PINIB|nr:hypothetical protein FSP39_016443 [Pinctada imbricata]
MMELCEDQIDNLRKSGRIIVFHNNKVYDVTEFADRHPGGREYMEEHAGRDVTQVMKAEKPHSHSLAAYSILKTYHIGHLTQKNGKLKHRDKNGEIHSYTNGSINGKIENGITHRMTNGKSESNGTVHTKQNGEIRKKPRWGPSDGKDDLIDWNKPILFQVPYLGDKYWEWVHTPIDGRFRLFYSDICEFCSVCPWWLVPLIWVPFIFTLLYLSYQGFQDGPVLWWATITKGLPMSMYHMPVLFLLGLLMWTLVEYVIHRWLFHMCPPANFPSIIWLHFLLHGQHHKAPMDKKRLVFPPVPCACLAFVVYSVYAMFAPATIAMCLFAGTVTGYVAYDMVHYYIHHGTPYGSYFKSLKSYHVKHHYKDQTRGQYDQHHLICVT